MAFVQMKGPHRKRRQRKVAMSLQERPYGGGRNLLQPGQRDVRPKRPVLRGKTQFDHASFDLGLQRVQFWHRIDGRRQHARTGQGRQDHQAPGRQFERRCFDLGQRPGQLGQPVFLDGTQKAQRQVKLVRRGPACFPGRIAQGIEPAAMIFR